MIQHHPAWPLILPYLVVEDRGDGKHVEFKHKGIAPDVMTMLEGVRVPCCSCGKPHQPIRPRKSNGDRMKSYRPYFISATCPNEVNPRCNRTKAARQAQLALVEAIAQWSSLKVQTDQARTPSSLQSDTAPSS